MDRADAVELLEDPSLPDEVAAKAYRELARTQCFLRNTAAIFRELRRNSLPIRRVLDIGCGHGALLEDIRGRLGVDVIGFDLRPAPASCTLPIVNGNAATDPLPEADVAICVCMLHHLSQHDAVALIRNASRSCRRLIVLDLVRHRIPLALFRVFLSPFLNRINAADGVTSIKRAFTPGEMRALVDEAVQGTGARVRHTVAPFYTRQIIDIEWR
ncbi:MAG TPA: methyltransferase domain-containing protein [Bryobacteraceae bacterium]|nr:methyltransferase domain-containing protein [Bryobacteraceae bacterium]